MTIDEAIEHAKKVARTCYDGQCATDHMQLAEWLRQARGADKAARWYTAKIRELENRSKALETLIGEKEAENAKLREASERDADVMEALNLSLEESQAENERLRELVRDIWHEGAFEAGACYEKAAERLEEKTRELGIEEDI